MNYLFNLTILFLSVFLFVSCNKNKTENNVKAKVPSKEMKTDTKAKTKVSEKNEVNLNKNNKYPDTAFIKGEVTIEDGILIQVLSKLDIYMSNMPKKEVEFIKSLKIENFKGIYWVMNKSKIYIKVKGLNILKIMELVNKKDNTPTPKYKEYQDFKYFSKGVYTIASNGKDSYLSSKEITIEEIAKTYDMNIPTKLNSLITESKNNGFYLSLYEESLLKTMTASFPPYLKNLKGASLFSYKDAGKNKLRLLAKLSEKDTKSAAENFDKMFRIYLPMILNQADGFKRKLLDKKDIDSSERDAYNKLIKEFIDMANSVEIKPEKDNLLITMDIKSLESTIVIIGALTAIAIPSYLQYIKKSQAPVKYKVGK